MSSLSYFGITLRLKNATVTTDTIEGVLQHVMIRGIEKRDIFFDDRDRGTSWGQANLSAILPIASSHFPEREPGQIYFREGTGGTGTDLFYANEHYCFLGAPAFTLND